MNKFVRFDVEKLQNKLEIWKKFKNTEKCEVALQRVPKALGHINGLLIQLTNEEFRDAGGK
jgi:hypothetical protein